MPFPYPGPYSLNYDDNGPTTVQKMRLQAKEHPVNDPDAVSDAWGYCGYCRRLEPVDLDGNVVRHEVSRAYREAVFCDGGGSPPQATVPTEVDIAKDARCHCPECDPEWSKLEDG